MSRQIKLHFKDNHGFPFGQLYCIDGNVDSPKDQTDYVVGFKDVPKESVRLACKEYICNEFDKKEFEKERGISIDKLVDDATVGALYQRYVPINEHSMDYDIWGSGVYSIYAYGGRGAKKVWVLHFQDDPYNEKTEEDK